MIKYIDVYLGKVIPNDVRDRLYDEMKVLKKDPQRLSDPALFNCDDIECVHCHEIVAFKNCVNAGRGPNIIYFCCSVCKRDFHAKTNANISNAKRDAIVQNALEAITSA